MDAKADPPDKILRPLHKTLEGVVVSDKMTKTRVIQAPWRTRHPRYRKVVHRTMRFYAHDEKDESHTGDRVEIMETRPLSRLKRWRITKILGRAG